jgi:hypothetical protein
MAIPYDGRFCAPLRTQHDLTPSVLPFSPSELEWFEDRNDAFHTVKRIERLQTGFTALITNACDNCPLLSENGMDLIPKFFDFIKYVISLLPGCTGFHYNDHL